jgi:hypothetical protein
MKAREFWDERQLSLFDYAEGKARNRLRKTKEHKHDSFKVKVKRRERSGVPPAAAEGVRVAFLRKGGPKGWEVITPGCSFSQWMSKKGDWISGIS